MALAVGPDSDEPGTDQIITTYALLGPLAVGLSLAVASLIHPAFPGGVWLLPGTLVSSVVTQGVTMSAVSGGAMALARSLTARRSHLMAVAALAGMCAGVLQSLAGPWSSVAFAPWIFKVAHPADLIVSGLVASLLCAMTSLRTDGLGWVTEDRLERVRGRVPAWRRRVQGGSGPGATFLAYVLLGPPLGSLDLLARGLARASTAEPMPPVLHDFGALAFLAIMWVVGTYAVGLVPMMVAGACVAVAAGRRAPRWALVMVALPAGLAGDLAFRLLTGKAFGSGWPTDRAHLAIFASVALATYLLKAWQRPCGRCEEASATTPTSARAS